MAKQIKAAKIGIVWHTTYKGNSFESMKASYGVKKIPSSPAVWSQDAELSGAGEATMNRKRNKRSYKLFKHCLVFFLTKLLVIHYEN